ncbi:SDR family oxidoreductase [Qipengyuania sp. GH25]|uniref:SDR family oxidoreductase n=1 Tax=Qipengyuania pacifica TaxID=2860199 RepID=A0ABS7JK82_9SPHN|nr:SDR family oxidoreductase [Qipengyuania aerophila]MBX7489794.1 SDR family oxidoreductase [Qipengyuania aerophila]
MNILKGKVAIVTGGNSGIGFAAANAFVSQGARVLIVGRRSDAVTEAVASLGDLADGFVGDVADISTHEEVRELVRQTYGGADIYFANAGMNSIAHSAEVTPEEYDRQFSVNARAVFFGVQSIVPMLNDNASVILTSSIASRKVMGGHAVYAGTKAAIEAFARSWAVEFKDRKIRFNVISPGPVRTPILGKLGISSESLPDFEAAVATAIPAGRFGEPGELARAALFLASDESTFINGVNLAVDGGMLVN